MTTETKLMLGIISISLALLVIFGFSSKPKTSPVTSTTQSIDTTGAVAQGPENAPVTIIEFADFQCPACGQAHPSLQRILKDYDGKIRFIHRHFPIPEIHKNALSAAQASEAAKAQDKFWPMYDQLFEHQNDWKDAQDPQPLFEAYAKAIGLNMDQFRTFYKNNQGTERITADQEEGTKLGVEATPTFFINGEGLSGAPSYNTLKQLIETALVHPEAAAQ